MQVEATDCGLTCLSMIMAYHDLPYDLDDLKRSFGSSLRGISLEGLSSISSAFKFVPRSLYLELDELNQLQVPCILHWSFTHFVVLKNVTKTHIEIHDPALGFKKISISDAGKKFTGYALELIPSGDINIKEVNDIKIARKIFELSGAKITFFKLFLVSLLVEFLVILTPLYQQWVVDGVISSGDENLLFQLAIGFGFIASLNASISIMRGWMIVFFTHDLNVKWMVGVFSHLIKLPYTFFEKRHLGDVISKFGSASSIAQNLTATSFVTLVDGLLALTTLVLMLIFNLKLAFISCCALIIQIAIKLTMYGPLSKQNIIELEAVAKENGHFIETIRGIKTIKSFNMEEDRKSHWVALFNRSMNSKKINEWKASLLGLTKNFVASIENIIILYFGALQVISGSLTTGLLFAFLMYKNQFVSRSANLVDVYMKFKMLELHERRVSEIVLQNAEDGYSEMISAENITPSIEFRNVFFRYSKTDPWIMNNTSFFIGSGESVVIVGSSGAGKSTLLKLIMGLEVPESGDILIGGMSIYKLGARTVRSLCASVMQDDSLFAGTLAENISLFSKNALLENIESSARLAAIHHEITSMPMGYSTHVSDMGSSLSGGQKQRILLARALFNRPKILILDEATSHLDDANEKKIITELKSIKVTRVSIAHRTNAINTADRVLKFVDGSVIEVDASDYISPIPAVAET